MSDDSTKTSTEPERDIRVLGNVVRSIEKLKDLEPGPGQPASAPKSGRAPRTADEEDQLRLQIVDRILKLRERRGKQGGPS